jgi:hypothetical protein
MMNGKYDRRSISKNKVLSKADELEHEAIFNAQPGARELHHPVLVYERNSRHPRSCQMAPEEQDKPERSINGRRSCADKVQPRQTAVKREEKNELLSLSVKKNVQAPVDTLIHPLNLSAGKDSGKFFHDQF